jgi:hypothetical protein
MNKKIWITRSRSHRSDGPKYVVSIWWIQKPFWHSDENNKFWWSTCLGESELISTKLSKQLFGLAPKEHEIYTAEETDDGYKITQRQTARDCYRTDVDRKLGLEW